MLVFIVVPFFLTGVPMQDTGLPTVSHKKGFAALFHVIFKWIHPELWVEIHFGIFLFLALSAVIGGILGGHSFFLENVGLPIIGIVALVVVPLWVVHNACYLLDAVNLKARPMNNIISGLVLNAILYFLIGTGVSLVAYATIWLRVAVVSLLFG